MLNIPAIKAVMFGGWGDKNDGQTCDWPAKWN